MGDIETYVKEIKPGIYLLDEGHAATGYLVVGDKKAAVIDTMCGENNLHDIVRGITDKPLVVINTHGHGDHICGNVFFDEAYERVQRLQNIDLSEIDVNMFRAIDNRMINDGCGLFRGRQILPFEHLSRFQYDEIR